MRTLRSLKRFGAAALTLGALACGGTDPNKLDVRAEDGTDLPLRAVTPELQARFNEGDKLFDVTYGEADGLGPLYIRVACSSCHQGASRGPGSVQKMAVVGADGVTPAEDQSALAYGHTVRPFKAAGATQAIQAPANATNVKLSLRVGPAVFGRGYLEAIADSEIERMQAEQSTRDDGIHGRVNRVTYHSQANPEQAFQHYQPGQTNLIGRFGVKARIASLDEFTADAMQGDMGITSPMRPTEAANPDGLTDDGKPGVDVDLTRVNAVGDYMRLLEIPKRAEPNSDGVRLFSQARCDVCHVPSLRTRADYPFAPLAGRDAPVYSDLLLHDMGPALADGMVDESAGSRDWRTAPLIGLRFFNDFLHDGRAKTLQDAILAHQGPGSEANDSVRRFQQLSSAEQTALIDFVSSL
ncbi:MAG: di-heme oxidoredictase family protein [Hyalangium sp.]|uniref:di-heme oxidoredictase family protein n=1 Tax=Hyalangium sp. TaxID=2028555 RepID=UPI00389A7CA5